MNNYSNQLKVGKIERVRLYVVRIKIKICDIKKIKETFYIAIIILYVVS